MSITNQRVELATLVLVASLAGFGCGSADRSVSRKPFQLPAGVKQDDPRLSCLGQCGGTAPGGCWCDTECAAYGDCCPDQASQCPACPALSPPAPGFCANGSI